MKLNMGAGATVIDGFIPVDRKHGNEAYPLSTIVLPQEVCNEHKVEHTSHAVDDDSVEEIRASHVLEHFSFEDVDHVLREWLRVLKPGGLLKLAVPDLDAILAMRERAGSASNGSVSETDKKWPLYLMGGQTTADDFHRSMFTRDGLAVRLTRCGYIAIEEWEDEVDDMAKHACSTRLQARKPEQAPNVEVGMHPDDRPDEVPADAVGDGIELKIAAVMSIPRLGFNDNWGCTLEALALHQIPVRRYSGAFWNQCMSNGLSEAIQDDLDWVLTIDYDSVFTWEHIDKMLGHFAANPLIHALAAMQARRGDQTPLMTKEGGGEVLLSGGPVRVTTAHFGLTLIRLADLAEVPKPWFHGEPDKEGGYRHWSRLDPDIYFWDRWKRAGKTVYMDPGVRIGHLELMVSEYDEKWEPRYVSVSQWRASQPGAPVTKRQ